MFALVNKEDGYTANDSSQYKVFGERKVMVPLNRADFISFVMV